MPVCGCPRGVLAVSFCNAVTEHTVGLHVQQVAWLHDGCGWSKADHASQKTGIGGREIFGKEKEKKTKEITLVKTLRRIWVVEGGALGGNIGCVFAQRYCQYGND